MQLEINPRVRENMFFEPNLSYEPRKVYQKLGDFT